MAEIDDSWPPELDALVAAPANHRLLFEDDALRVTEITVEPGERENLHHHRWPSVMIILQRPSFVHVDAKGDVVPPALGTPVNLALPRVVRMPPQGPHAIEVDAAAPHRFHGFRIELKGPDER